MSNTLFPSTLPGLLMSLDRDVDFDVTTQTTLTRKELRYTYETIPITHYKLGFEILRSDSSLANRTRELQQVLTHIARHYGQLDSFLLTDLADSSVSDHGFGVGDGSTTAFQLQRTLGGDLIDAAGFEYQAQTKAYTNLLKNSSFETDTNADGQADNWATYTNSGATEPMWASIIPGLNGGKAQRVSWGIANTTTKGIQQSSSSSPVWLAGQWYTASFFARASGSNIGKWMGMGWNTAPSSAVLISNPPLTASWQRYVFQLFWNLGTSPTAEMYLSISNAQGNGNGVTNNSLTTGDLDFDLVQVVAGQHGAAEFQPVETPAAATAARTPAYWPAYADGFEPISDLNGDATITLEADGLGKRTLYPWVRTNLILRSEVFDNATWTKAGNASINADLFVAPDGTSTADKLQASTTVNAEHYAEQSFTAANLLTVTASVFLKASNKTWGFLSVVQRDAATVKGAFFDLINGVTGTVDAGVTASMLYCGNGWWRCSITLNVGSGGTAPRIRVEIASANNVIVYVGVVNEGIAVWGAQVEQSAYLGDYIQTVASTVARTDYTLSATGLVTFAVAPRALNATNPAAQLAWTGSYYRRVRFAERNLTVSQMVQSMWEAKSISLQSVKP